MISTVNKNSRIKGLGDTVKGWAEVEFPLSKKERLREFSLRRWYLNQGWKGERISHEAIWAWIFLAEGQPVHKHHGRNVPDVKQGGSVAKRAVLRDKVRGDVTGWKIVLQTIMKMVAFFLVKQEPLQNVEQGVMRFNLFNCVPWLCESQLGAGLGWVRTEAGRPIGKSWQ